MNQAINQSNETIERWVLSTCCKNPINVHASFTVNAFNSKPISVLEIYFQEPFEQGDFTHPGSKQRKPPSGIPRKHKKMLKMHSLNGSGRPQKVMDYQVSPHTMGPTPHQMVSLIIACVIVLLRVWLQSLQLAVSPVISVTPPPLLRRLSPSIMMVNFLTSNPRV